MSSIKDFKKNNQKMYFSTSLIQRKKCTMKNFILQKNVNNREKKFCSSKINIWIHWIFLKCNKGKIRRQKRKRKLKLILRYNNKTLKYNIELTKIEPSNKLKVIKELKNLLGIGLKDVL